MVLRQLGERRWHGLAPDRAYARRHLVAPPGHDVPNKRPDVGLRVGAAGGVGGRGGR